MTPSAFLGVVEGDGGFPAFHLSFQSSERLFETTGNRAERVMKGFRGDDLEACVAGDPLSDGAASIERQRRRQRENYTIDLGILKTSAKIRISIGSRHGKVPLCVCSYPYTSPGADPSFHVAKDD